MSERIVDGPARATVEPQVWSDARFRAVARITGLDFFSVVGRHARLWAECVALNTYHLPAATVDLFAEHDGFADAMVQARLASRDEDWLYIHGTKGRVEWLAAMMEQRREAGRASARKRAGKVARDDGGRWAGANDAPTRTEREPNENGTRTERPVRQSFGPRSTAAERKPNENRTSGSGSEAEKISTTVEMWDLAPPLREPDSETVGVASPRAGARSQGSGSDHQAFVAEWDRLYSNAHGGERYGWADTRQFRLVKELLAAHGLKACLERAHTLLGPSCPGWLRRDGGGRDLATLKANWNKLARSSDASTVRADDLAQLAMEQLAREREEGQR